MNKILVLILGLVLFTAAGCSMVQEGARLVWGSSTKALNDARPQAIKKEFICAPDQCFDAVLKFANAESVRVPDENFSLNKKAAIPVKNKTPNSEAEKTVKVKNFDVFLQDPQRHIIVVMGVPGSVNTTEVGLFLTPGVNGGTLVEVSSLSTAAKTRAAEILFPELDKQFPKP